MAKFSVNPDDQYPVLPKGAYTVVIESAVLKESKQEGGHPFILCDFVIADGEYANQTFDDRISLSPKAAARKTAFIAACGLIPPGAQGAIDFDTDDLRGLVLVVKGEPGEFKGFKRFDVKSFEMHPDTAAKFAAAPAPEAAPAAPAPAPAQTAPAAAAAPAPAAAPTRAAVPARKAMKI